MASTDRGSARGAGFKPGLVGAVFNADLSLGLHVASADATRRLTVIRRGWRHIRNNADVSRGELRS